MNSLEQETKLPVINNDLASSSFEDRNWMNFPSQWYDQYTYTHFENETIFIQILIKVKNGEAKSQPCV